MVIENIEKMELKMRSNDNSKEGGYMNCDCLVQVLKEQVKPALGCTEPVAVGIGVAEAYNKIGGNVEKILVKLSPNILKNGMRVGIPGTQEKGLVFATALAIVCGDSKLGLEVFKNVDDDFVQKAKEFMNRNIIDIDVEDKKGNFYIETKVITDKGYGLCIIKESHTNIVYVEANDEIVFQKDSLDKKGDNQSVNEILRRLSLKDIRKFVETVPFEDIKFLLDGVKINMDIAMKGLEKRSGTGLGAAINDLIEKGIIEKDVVNQARIFTSAACDARMSGVNMPVMSSAGSGNQGITAIIPPTVVCRNIDCGDEKLARTLAFSHLTTSYIKVFTGRLSPVCGCAIAAGIGASAAITWLLGGNDLQIEGAIKNMVGSICGMVCDGAKGGCAFKLATAASEAIIQANLAINNVFVSNFDGIIGNGAEETIRNLGQFCTDGMKDMDKEIIKIMLSN